MPPTAESPKATKKSGRSTSPRAVERRRLQNRLSQRKHRQRVKESTQTAEATSGSQTDSDTQDLHRSNDPLEAIENYSRPVPAESRSKMQRPLTENDHDPFWLSVDPTMMLPTLVGNESRGSQPASISSICACGSGVITPGNHAAPHHDYLSTDSAPQRRQRHYTLSNPSSSACPSSLAGLRANCNVSHRTTCAKNSSGSTSTMDATFRKPFDQSQSQMRPTPLLSPTSELHSIPCAPGEPDPLGADDELAAAAELGAAEATDITRRLALVLEAIRTAGFQGFDDTAAAYYTAHLDKGSFPAMVQCASRGRRLKTMLQTLQQSSQQWRRWESRGLQESICEGSASLCVAEIRFSSRSVQVCDENEPASLITALESLLSSHKAGILGETRVPSLTPPEESGLME